MATLILNATQLQAMNDDLTADYELGANINASATSTWNEDPGNPGTYFGFDPIGMNSPYFTGSFDGKGYTINNLYINRPTNASCGLFGVTGDGCGTIQDVGLVDCDITGRSFTGALIGYQSVTGGAVSTCYSTGSVSGERSGSSSLGAVGGLIGYATGSITSCYSTCTVTATHTGTSYIDSCGGLIGSHAAVSTVTSCYATGAISITAQNDILLIGGLIGNTDAVVSKCYSIGSVTIDAGEDADQIGGFIGENTANISDCYARGAVAITAGVTANSGDIGGFVGLVNNVNAILDDCYSTGAITATDIPDVGGFCGDNSGTVTNCFWDTQTSGTEDSDGGTGKTTTQMKAEATFTDAGWDFSAIWGIEAVTNDGYPALIAVGTAPTVTTQAVSSIAATTATGNGNITDLGSPDPIAHGVCYNTTGSPTVADSTTDEGAATTTGAFTSSMTSLSINTKYYVKAYAANAVDTSYGSEINFTTLGIPTIITQTCESVLGATATGRGDITVIGNPTPTAHGHCWNTSADPTTSDSSIDNGAASAVGTFTSAITGLTPGTAYYTRAFAENSEGTVYGDNVYFVASTARAGYTWDESSNLRSFDENALERQYIHFDDLASIDVPVTLNSSLNVAGAITGTSASLSSTLGVAGITQLQRTLIHSTLSVAGQTTLAKTIIGSTLGVAGLASFVNVFVTNDITVGGTVDGIDISVLDAAVVKKADFTEDTFLYAATASTPVATSPADVLAALSGHAASSFSMNSQKITSLLTPTVSTDAANKEYVDLAVSDIRFDYYFNDTASNLDSYYEMNPSPTGDDEHTFTTPGALSGDTQDLFEWISDAVVVFDTIEAGVIDTHIHASRATGNRSVEIYAEIYEYKANTDEVLIATTEVSSVITDKVAVSLHATLSADYEIADTSKLLVKFLANVATVGQPTTVSLFTEGANASRVGLPVPSSALEAVFVKNSLYDANTILAANSNDTPIAVSVAEQRIVGRITSGNITALTAAQVATLVQGSIDHGSIAGLGGDDHTQYFLLAGEATDAKLYSSADLTLYSDAGSTVRAHIDGASGHIGLGGNSAIAEATIYIDETYNPTAGTSIKVLDMGISAYVTSGTHSGILRGLYYEADILNENTQNWTSAVGVRGVESYTVLVSGTAATKTITGVANFYGTGVSMGSSANDMALTNFYGLYIKALSLVGGSKLTNDYGIYIGNQAGGATLNYAIKTGTGAVYFGDDVTLSTGKALKSDSSNGNTLLLKANDTTFITLTTGATDACSINENISVDSGKTIDGIDISAHDTATTGVHGISGTIVGTSESQALTNKSYNGMTLTSTTGTFTLASGKTLTVSNTLTLTATDSATLAIGSGGTLGSAAYTASTDYVAKATFDAHSLLIAVSDDTPIKLDVAASRIVGRAAAGNIVALAKADVLTIINVTDGADVTGSNPPQAHEASHASGGSDDIDAALNPAAVALTTRGDVLFHDASGLQRLAKGTEGHVLTMGANDPAWAAAGGNGGAFTEIGDTTLAAPAASVEFGSIAAGYAVFLLMWHDVYGDSTAIQTLYLRFNSDSGSNYDENFTSYNAGPTTAHTRTYITIGTLGDTDGTERHSNGQIFIFNRASQEGIVMGKSLYVREENEDINPARIEGKWRNEVDEIDTITLLPHTGNLVAGSRFILLGIST